MSKSISPSVLTKKTNEDLEFDPSRINVFLDIAENDLIPKLIKYINLNGGKSSPFLDISVTHVVTDKAKTITEIYHMTQKWNLKVWTVEEFASHLLSYMYAKGTKVNSPTLLKLTAIKRDLSQCLQEEKRQSKPTKNNSATTQFASSRNSSSGNDASNSIAFIPFEAFYVVIEDLEGLHCPIFKEYPLQWPKEEFTAHFKVPRLPYPVFYWESPVGQCAFIPPLLNESNHQGGVTRKSSQQAPAPNNLNQKQVSAGQDLRTRAVRNSSVKASLLKQQQPQNNIPGAPRIVFEPAMTDTSILTAKTNLKRQQHPYHSRHHHQGIHPVNYSANANNNQNNQNHQNHFQPLLKITPNFSVNVNRATAVSATTPKQAAARNDAEEQRKKEKASTAHHRPRPGFCECCCEKYSELEKHVKEPMHRQFALQIDNYEGIDKFLGGLKRPLKAEYLLNNSSFKNHHNVIIPDDSDISLILQNSPISPSPSTTNTSHNHHMTSINTNNNSAAAAVNTTTARNYTGTKKLKQSLASKRIKMIANTTTSSILDEEDAEASGVITALSAPGPNAEANYISSPSCKRRKSFKIVQ